MSNGTTSISTFPAVPGYMEEVVTDMTGVEPIENSELQKIAEDVLARAKYTFVAVAANPQLADAARADSLEGAFKDALQAMETRPDKTAIERVRKTSIEMKGMAVNARRALFGRYGTLDTESLLGTGFDRVDEVMNKSEPLRINPKLLGVRVPTITVPLNAGRVTTEGLLLSKEILPAGLEALASGFEEAANRAVQSQVFDAERLTQIWGPNYSAEESEFEAAGVTDKLALHITRVKCVDETNPEWWGSDEIGLAGVKVTPSGNTLKISEVYIGGGFDDGDQKTYRPAWQYSSFSLREGEKWPKRCHVTLILAEKDYGGLSSAMNKIWLYIRDAVKKQIEAWITAGLSEWLGPLLASWIGKAVAWIIDKLVSWLIELFQDDIFPPQVATVSVPSYTARWAGGSTTSSIRTAHFYGYGGHYIIDYYWRLYA